MAVQGIGQALMAVGDALTKSALAAKAEDNKEKRRLRLEANAPGDVVWTEQNGQLYKTTMTKGGSDITGRYIPPRVLNERPATEQERTSYFQNKQSNALSLNELLSKSADRDVYGRSMDELQGFAESEDPTVANAARKEIERQLTAAKQDEFKNRQLSALEMRASNTGSSGSRSLSTTLESLGSYKNPELDWADEVEDALKKWMPNSTPEQVSAVRTNALLRASKLNYSPVELNRWLTDFFKHPDGRTLLSKIPNKQANPQTAAMLQQEAEQQNEQTPASIR